MEIRIRIPDQVAHLEIEDVDENMKAFYRELVDKIHIDLQELIPNTLTGIIIDIIF